MPTPKTAIITGADENYFWLLAGLIQSLRRINPQCDCDLVVLDFGLSSGQVSRLKEEWEVTVVAPECVVDVPPKFGLPRYFAFSLRCALPRVVPGYDVYLWMDSDTWVQDDSFIHAFVASAQKGKLAIVPESEPAYHTTLELIGWNLKNQVRGFGIADGIRVFCAPAINNGVFAARRDHPLWGAWEARYLASVRRANKVVMDQHSLKAVIRLDAIEVEYLDSSFNWLCSRAAPMFDRVNQLFCVPRPPYGPISVLHLAGNSKNPNIAVPLRGGGSTVKSILFDAGEYQTCSVGVPLRSET